MNIWLCYFSSTFILQEIKVFLTALSKCGIMENSKAFQELQELDGFRKDVLINQDNFLSKMITANVTRRIEFNSADFCDYSVTYLCYLISFFQLQSYEPQAEDNTPVRNAINA